MSFFVKKLAVIGVGLIGGSLAQALKEQGAVGEVSGCARRPETLRTALEMGVIDVAALTPEEAAAGASLVILATPVTAIVPAMAALAPHLAKGAIVSDVGSVKGDIVRRCEALTPEGRFFVGAHPIAGREYAGVAHSLPSLFQGSRTILTPTPRTPPQALEYVRLVWEMAGSQVETMDCDHHDRVLAATSHLPHLMAYNVVNTLTALENDLEAEVFRYAASGFRDFTRIASSDPTMWRDICLENRQAIVETLQRFKGNLEHLEGMVARGEGAALFDFFQRAKSTRDRVIAKPKPTVPGASS